MIEDDISLEELDTLQAQWAHQKELEHRELILNTIIAHHELDLMRGTNTAMKYAISNGLTSEFEQYLTERKRNERQ